MYKVSLKSIETRNFSRYFKEFEEANLYANAISLAIPNLHEDFQVIEICGIDEGLPEINMWLTSPNIHKRKIAENLVKLQKEKDVND